ncbi:MAG: hypothetical protein EAZ26_09560 [Runella slithyformis]|nr:MAG: hypothetical protein EAZ26_09560 [Runella slithyformis]
MAAAARKLPIKILDRASGKVRGRAAETQEFMFIYYFCKVKVSFLNKPYFCTLTILTNFRFF